MNTLLLLAVGAFIVTLVQCQLSIPPRELGFVYRNNIAGSEVHIATYIDLTCPDSQASFPTLVKVADLYQPHQVQLKVYLFSLPYHRNSHTISKAARVLNNFKSPKGATVYDWIQVVYDNINSLSTAATASQTDVDVLNFLSSLAYNVTGISDADFKSGVSNVDIDQATRLEWKYGCTRGVYGTPLFTVNDVFYNADPTWPVSQWTNLIDNLLASSKKHKSF